MNGSAILRFAENGQTVARLCPQVRDNGPFSRTDVAITLDIQTFFDIYVRPKGSRLDRNGFAARYAAAALLVACSKADDDEDIEEKKVIADILANTFELSGTTIEQLLRLANLQAGSLSMITDLVNEYYKPAEKRMLLQQVWRVAYADGRIDVYEEKFVDRVAELLGMSEDAVKEARDVVSGEAAPIRPS